VQGRQGTDPDGNGMLLTLRENKEKFSEIIKRRRKKYLILWAGKNLEHRHPDELTDDLWINRGLKNHPTVIVSILALFCVWTKSLMCK